MGPISDITEEGVIHPCFVSSGGVFSKSEVLVLVGAGVLHPCVCVQWSDTGVCSASLRCLRWYRCVASVFCVQWSDTGVCSASLEVLALVGAGVCQVK